MASFAATTLDTACRLQRYVVQELASTFAPRSEPTGESSDQKTNAFNPFGWLTNKHGATIFAIVIAGLIAALPAPGAEWSMANAGKGGLILWPLFGATNQLLGGLAFLVITFWMWRRNLPIWFVALPTIFMLILPAIGLSLNLFGEAGWLAKHNWLLVFIGFATLALEIWMIIEAFIAFPKAKGILEPELPPLPVTGVVNEGGRSC